MGSNSHSGNIFNNTDTGTLLLDLPDPSMKVNTDESRTIRGESIKLLIIKFISDLFAGLGFFKGHSLLDKKLFF